MGILTRAIIYEKSDDWSSMMGETGQSEEVT